MGKRSTATCTSLPCIQNFDDKVAEIRSGAYVLGASPLHTWERTRVSQQLQEPDTYRGTGPQALSQGSLAHTYCTNTFSHETPTKEITSRQLWWKHKLLSHAREIE